MCCLFGMVDYGNNFTGRQKALILSALGLECEARGTDATGVAYHSGGGLQVYKRPLPAHKLRLVFPNDAQTIMGHTRMTTQGSEKRNYNNHPFKGVAGGMPFALAHNGVLHNDVTLRRSLKLPQTNIETDSFVCVQLLERFGGVGFDSLRYMAEQVEGSFTFTVLDSRDNLYFVKGDNPLCLVHFPRLGLYLYASTEEILSRTLKKLHLPLGKPVRVEASCGDILCIDAHGAITADHFDASRLFQYYRYAMYCPSRSYAHVTQRTSDEANSAYLDELKSVAGAFGYSPDDIDYLAAQGIGPDEIEEMLYYGEM